MHETEFVAVDRLFEAEIAQGSDLGLAVARARQAGAGVPDRTALAVLRHWFWSRKARRGFVLAGFPATVAQAVVFDAWLEERDVTLTGAVWVQASATATFTGRPAEDASRVAAYYRDQGLLLTMPEAESPEAVLAAFCEQASGLVADR